MKKGFNINAHTDLVPAYYDVVYVNAMLGKTLDPMFTKYWEATNTLKRGLIHQPVLSKDDDVNDNASAFLGMLNDLSYLGWNNDVPLMIDIWKAPEEYRYNLDHIRQHGIYITQYYKPKLKPLLRVIVSTWKAWYEANTTETIRLLTDYTILLCQPGVQKPSELTGIGVATWWEYDWGMYAQDLNGIFDGVVKPPEPVEEPVPVTPPAPPVTPQPTAKKKYKVSLLGGLISGTIEEIE